MSENILILCNKEHPIKRDYIVDLHTLPNGVQIDARIAHACEAIMAALDQQGFCYEYNGYRTWEMQEGAMRWKTREYQNAGYSYEEALEMAKRTVAIPGASEHQLGLAMDISSASDVQQEARLFAWLAENAHRFGFILRYPADKTHITGIDYEPWHFRYVGTEPAQTIFERGICLEEYLRQL